MNRLVVIFLMVVAPALSICLALPRAGNAARQHHGLVPAHSGNCLPGRGSDLLFHIPTSHSGNLREPGMPFGRNPATDRSGSSCQAFW